MEIPQIITDFDDQDTYKYYMSYYVFKKHPNSLVEYSLFNRGEHEFPEGFGDELRKQVNYFKNIRFTDEQEKFFRNSFKAIDGTPYFDEAYYTFLRGYRYKPEDVEIHQIGTKLIINIQGYFIDTIFWECQLMAVICELYYIMTGQIININDPQIEINLKNKFDAIRETKIKVAEFGLRRRYSKAYEEKMFSYFVKNYPDVCVGTSNVWLARKYNTKALGTMAHEIFLHNAVKVGVLHANTYTLGSWSDVFHGSLGTALSDTFGTDNFLKNFDIFYSKLYDGVRWDSGDWKLFTDKMINHYISKGIDPKSKTIIFTDSIKSIEMLKEMHDYRNGEILKSTGIGTWLSNDVGVKPMNIVIKMTQAKPGKNWGYCVKISDSKGKYTYTDKTTLERYLEELNK